MERGFKLYSYMKSKAYERVSLTTSKGSSRRTASRKAILSPNQTYVFKPTIACNVKDPRKRNKEKVIVPRHLFIENRKV